MERIVPLFSLTENPTKPMYEEPFHDAYYTLRDIVENVQCYTPLPGHKVLDLGAHKGWFSIYCVSRMATVRAYEPEPNNFRVLADIAHPSITAINAGIWSLSGEIPFYPSPVNSGNGSFILRNRSVSYPIPVVTFTEALDGQEWDCVKIDVEGSEREIIMSATDKDFALIRYLTLEVHNTVYTQEEHDTMMDRLKDFFNLRVVAERPGRFNYVYCDRK